MLKDRKILIDQEIQKQIHLCASLYKQMVMSGNTTGVAMMDYTKEREKLANLLLDLEVVNSMLENEDPVGGHNFE